MRKSYSIVFLIFFATFARADTEIVFPGGDIPPVTTGLPFLVEVGGTYNDGADLVLGKCLTVVQTTRDGKAVKRFVSSTSTCDPVAPVLSPTPTATVTGGPTPSPTSTPGGAGSGGIIPIILFDENNIISTGNDIRSVYPNIGSPLTITEVCCEVDNATDTKINLFRRNDGGAYQIMTTNLSCGSKFYEHCSSTFQLGREAIATGDGIDFALVTNSAAKRISVAIKTTIP